MSPSVILDLLKPKWQDFFHHLKAALLVGSIVSLTHSYGLLGWLDALMLMPARLSDTHATTPLRSEGDMPVVVLIDKATYETGFAQRSPLDRNKLATLLDDLSKEDSRPKVLALDLDLSPIPGDEADQRAQNLLDEKIRALASKGTRVILARPFSTRTLVELKHAWMSRLCAVDALGRKPNLLFGSVELKSHFGQIVQYEVATPTLGILAVAPESPLPTCPPPAALLSDLAEHIPDQSREHVSKFKPFNARFFQHVDRHVLWVGGDGHVRATNEAGEPVSTRGRTVFIGGAYDDRDQFHVPVGVGSAGKTEGVIVHAAVYFSEKFPLNSGDASWVPWAAFVLDLCVGFVMGYLFAATWSLDGLFKRWTHDHAALAYIASRFSLLLNVVILMTMLYVFLWLAYECAYPNNWWIHPGPIILGVFIKFLINRESGSHSSHEHGSHARTYSLLTWLEVCVLLGFAAYNLAHH